MRFHHAGVATHDLDDLIDRYAAVFGVEVLHTETTDGMRIAFIGLENGYLELLEPVDDAGPIARYLSRADTAIHHLAFAVDDIEAALDRASEAGVELIDEQPRPGAWGHTIAFLHPRDTGGVLTEFVQE